MEDTINNNIIETLDSLKLTNEAVFPVKMTLNECYISTVKLMIDFWNPGNRQYLSVEIAVAVNSACINIRVLMTIDELKKILNKSTNQRLADFIESKLTKLNQLPEGCLMIREWFDTYLYCKELGFEVIQGGDEKKPAEHQNLYSTKGLCDFLRC